MKMKSKKAILKRFKLTGTGKLTRRRQHGRHLKSSKSKKQKRRFATTANVHPAFEKKIKRFINV